MPSSSAAPSRTPSTAYPLLLLAALAVSTAGCLEATAPTPDGGTTPDTGSHTTPDTGTPTPDGKIPLGDGAMTGMDATRDVGTAPKDAGHDAATIPICTSPTAGETACNTCVESSCPTETAAALAACATFYTCYAACACSDMSCITTCEGNAPSACDTPATNLISCQMSMCATACAPPDAGTTVPDSGPPHDGGATLPLCKEPTTAETTCNDCLESSCKSQATAALGACGPFYSCYAACDCSDTSCITTCEGKAPSGCDTPAENLITCQKSDCATACGGADGGTTDGGTTSGIPDCKDPTSAEATTYASCSACDNTHCATEVSAAVAACTMYYACFAATDCTEAIDTCYATYLEEDGCSTAAGDLGDCQEFSCSTECE